MKIMNNVSSMLALGELKRNDTAFGKTMKKLSTGIKLNSAGDGASSYSISKKMRTRLRALEQCEDNAFTGQRLLSIALGAVDEQLQMGKRLREITLEAMTDSVTDKDRRVLQREVDQILDQMDDIAYNTEYNGQKLLCDRTVKTYTTTWNYYNNDNVQHESLDKNGDTLPILAQADLASTPGYDKDEGWTVPPGTYRQLPETPVYDATSLVRGDLYTEIPAENTWVWSNEFNKVCKVQKEVPRGDLYVDDGSGNKKYIEVAGKTPALNQKSTISNVYNIGTDPLGRDCQGSTLPAAPSAGQSVWSSDFNKVLPVQSDNGKLYVTDGTQIRYVEVENITPARNTVSTTTNIYTIKHPQVPPPSSIGNQYALSEVPSFDASGNITTPVYDVTKTPGTGKLSIFDNSVQTSPRTSVYELDFSKLQEAYDNGKVDIPSGLHNTGFSVECGECTTDPNNPHCPQYISVLFDANTTESHTYYGTLSSSINYGHPEPNPVYYVVGVKNLDKNNIEKSLSEILYNGIKEAQKNEVFNTATAPSDLHQMYTKLAEDEKVKSGISGDDSVDFANRHHLDLNYHKETGKLTLSKYGPIMRIKNSTLGSIEEVTDSVSEKLDYKELVIQGDPKSSFKTIEKLYSTTFNDLFMDLADDKAIIHKEVIGTRKWLVTPGSSGTPGSAVIVGDTTSNSDMDTVISTAPPPPAGTPPAGMIKVPVYRVDIVYEDVLTEPDENDNCRVEKRPKKVMVIDHYEDQPASSGTPAPPQASSGSDNYEYGATTPTGRGDNSYWLEENEIQVTACHKFDCVLTRKKATIFLSALDPAIDKLLDVATTLGAETSRLDFTSSNLTTEHENLSSAESVIRDADMAREMTAFAKHSLLMQASQSMLAQSNQNASQVMSLLQ